MAKKYNLIHWRPFEDARKYVHKQKITSESEWRIYSRSGKRPYDIPSNPNREYKSEGWTNWGDWLGTNSIATQQWEFLPFEQAREFVHGLRFKNQHEWFAYSKSGEKPKNIPQKPNRTYLDLGWINWGDWLGTGNIAHKDIVFLPFKKARKYVRNIGLKNTIEWHAYCTSGDRPIEVPANPDKIYRSHGWINYADWLGHDGRDREFLPFREARKFARSLNLKKMKEWEEFSKAGMRPKNVPAKPNKIYKKKGWKSWPDWLGYTPYKKKFLAYDKAKKIIHKLNMETYTEWRRYAHKGNRPDNIPSNPHTFYKDEGWKGWDDWLGR